MNYIKQNEVDWEKYTKIAIQLVFLYINNFELKFIKKEKCLVLLIPLKYISLGKCIYMFQFYFKINLLIYNL